MLLLLPALLACNATLTLADLEAPDLVLTLDNDGLISEPINYGVNARLDWSGTSGTGCSALSELNVGFADVEFDAYDLGGPVGLACNTTAVANDVFDAGAWLDAESGEVRLFDSETTLTATVSYPVAMRRIDPDLEQVHPGDTVTFTWWPPTDELTDTVDIWVTTEAGDSLETTAEVVDGQLTWTIPEDAGAGWVTVAVTEDRVAMEVLSSSGFDTVAVDALLFHWAEGTITVEVAE